MISTEVKWHVRLRPSAHENSSLVNWRTASSKLDKLFANDCALLTIFYAKKRRDSNPLDKGAPMTTTFCHLLCEHRKMDPAAPTWSTLLLYSAREDMMSSADAQYSQLAWWNRREPVEPPRALVGFSPSRRFPSARSISSDNRDYGATLLIDSPQRQGQG